MAPDAKVKLPPPVIVVKGEAICKVEALFTVNLTSPVTVPPEV